MLDRHAKCFFSSLCFIIVIKNIASNIHTEPTIFSLPWDPTLYIGLRPRKLLNSIRKAFEEYYVYRFLKCDSCIFAENWNSFAGICCLHLQDRKVRMRQRVPPKCCCLPTKLNGVTSQRKLFYYSLPGFPHLFTTDQCH
jgi:hypothetical protein